MNLTIIPADSLVKIDNVVLHVDLSSIAIDLSNWHAVQWRESAGLVEHKDGSKPSFFSDLSFVQPIIDLHAGKLAEVNAPLPLAEYQELRAAEMDAAASAAIRSGFTSSALGLPHHYGGKTTDQLNLIGAASADANMPYPCADGSDVWARREHTAAQLKQVLLDGSIYKQSVLVALDVKRNEIEIAIDHDQVDAVLWIGV